VQYEKVLYKFRMETLSLQYNSKIHTDLVTFLAAILRSSSLIIFHSNIIPFSAAWNVVSFNLLHNSRSREFS
jgi:hypothetical protein